MNRSNAEVKALVSSIRESFEKEARNILIRSYGEFLEVGEEMEKFRRDSLAKDQTARAMTLLDLDLEKLVVRTNQINQRLSQLVAVASEFRMRRKNVEMVLALLERMTNERIEDPRSARRALPAK